MPFTISGDVATLLGGSPTSPQTTVALSVQASQPVIMVDDTGRMGGTVRIPIASDGTFSLSDLPATTGGVAPLYRLNLDAASLRKIHPRGVATGWFPLTADRDLEWIVANYVETTLVTEELAADIAAAAALGATNDSATASFVNNTTSATARALAAATMRDPVAGINARLAASRRGPVKVIMLGSSTTEGVGATTPNLRWVNQFARAVQAAYPSGVTNWEPPVVTLAAAAAAVPTLPGVHVINGGVGGAGSATYCDSTKRGQADTVNPSIVVHMIGSNDQALGVSPATFATNLSTAMTQLDSLIPDLIHVVCDTFARADLSAPAYPWGDYLSLMRAVVESRPDSAVFISQYAEWEAAEATGYDPVDPYRLTAWRIGSGGNIHPSDAGHGLLAAMVARGLRIPPPRPPVAPEVADRFNRAAVGSAETGQPWVVQSGAFAIDANGLTVTTGGNLVVATNFSDAEVSATITHSTSATAGLIAKSNSDTTRIAAFLAGANNRVDLYAGTTLLASSSALGLVNARDYHMALTVINDAVTVNLDGVTVLTYTLASGTATTYSAYTSHGVRCSASGGITRWKNFAVRRL